MDQIAGGARAREEGEAVRIAGECFGLSARARRLPGEKDLNFRLDLADGRRMLLKIFTQDAEPALVAMFGAALEHVARVDPTLAVQRLVPTRAGEAACAVRFLGGAARMARMVSFLDGIALDDSPHSAAQRRAVGATSARLQLALRDFVHPAAERALVWDMKTAPSLRPCLEFFDDADQRGLLAAVLDAYEARIGRHLGELPAQAVHNDFNGNNLLVGSDAPDRVTGVIDFDDMVRTPRLFDIAVAGAYQILDEEDPVAALCDFARGFASVLRPGAREIALFYTAVRTRMAMRVIVPEWRAREIPDNRAYLTRNSALVWRQFARLARGNEAEASARIGAAFAEGAGDGE